MCGDFCIYAFYGFGKGNPMNKIQMSHDNIGKKKTKSVIVGVIIGIVIMELFYLFYCLGVNQGKKQVEERAEKFTKTEENNSINNNSINNNEQAATGLGNGISGGAVSAGATGANAISPNTVSANAISSNTVSGNAVSKDKVSGQEVDVQSQNDKENNQADKENGDKTHNNESNQKNNKTSGYAGKLKVVGNQLCTSNGKPIQLRGVSTHGLSWYPDYVNKDMFRELKSWGANTVRLAMYTAEYNGYCTGDDKNRKELKKLVKKGVEYATEQDLYVIIDWHILSDGNPNTYKSQAISFFKEMAELYKNNDHVIYEICNEPNGGVSWSQIKDYAKDIIKVIRQKDSDGVILVGTPTWSQEVDKAAADPIKDYKNIMYTLHFYADTHRDSLRNTLKNAVEDGLPVFVSEFGICDASGNGSINTKQADKWMKLLNQYGVSYVSWNLSNKAESSALIQSGCSKNNNISKSDLSESGKWLLKTLQGSINNSSTSKNTGTGNSTNSGNNSNNSNSSNISNNLNSSNNSNNNNSSNNSNNSSGQNKKTPEKYTPQCGGGAQVKVSNSWQEGDALCVQYDIKVVNNSGSTKNGWTGTLTFPAKATVVSGWNANFSSSGKKVTFTNMDYNKTIAGGSQVEGIGCIIKIE